ncbi:hypothetical protein NMY22_g20289 [Coprinellus aureogranulatus]|nr:hypothetical protein NMY22_g20289 [Coprinellus aureogranulatus]
MHAYEQVNDAEDPDAEDICYLSYGQWLLSQDDGSNYLRKVGKVLRAFEDSSIQCIEAWVHVESKRKALDRGKAVVIERVKQKFVSTAGKNSAAFRVFNRYIKSSRDIFIRPVLYPAGDKKPQWDIRVLFKELYEVFDEIKYFLLVFALIQSVNNDDKGRGEV